LKFSGKVISIGIFWIFRKCLFGKFGRLWYRFLKTKNYLFLNMVLEIRYFSASNDNFRFKIFGKDIFFSGTVNTTSNPIHNSNNYKYMLCWWLFYASGPVMTVYIVNDEILICYLFYASGPVMTVYNCKWWNSNMLLVEADELCSSSILLYSIYSVA